ncbi:transcription termination factor Rho [Thermogutta terrifontis]|nr:transcription termination factor Rho [Thermogutta terrifontis]
MTRKKHTAMRSKNGQAQASDNKLEKNGSNGALVPQEQQSTSVQTVESAESNLYEGGGVLELHPSGYGFLRDPAANYERRLTDPFVPGSMIEKYGLRQGVYIKGLVQPGKKGQGPRLREIHDVDGIPPQEYPKVKHFDELTPINPEEWLRLETGPEPITTRVMDLLTPIGKGQRALIVAPPRTGKTVLLQHISLAIAQNYPDMKLIILLIDERPEEVTDFRRVCKNAEVVASSLDCEIESHVRLSQLIVERCKRLAEMGKDVFLLMDSITRLARAFNKWVGNTGRTMTGGIDVKAMDIPKKLFATARAFEEGGSLTIVATALIDTGSRMDELIFQEFKGTGNMELVLDRRLADRRIWPAIDITQSGTRREEKLLPPEYLKAVTILRRMLSSMNPVEAMEQLTQKLAKYKSNQEFIELIAGAQAHAAG